MKKFFSQLFVVLALAVPFVMPEVAHATSLLGTGALTGVQTDAIDTVKDVVTQMLPIMIGIMVAWSVLSYVKKGFGKAGIK